MRAALALSCLLVASCGSDDTTALGWQTLVDGEWTVAAGSESYICVRTELPRAMTLDGFRAPAISGTHHALLTIAEDSEPLGTAPCSASSTGARALFATGIAGASFALPSGVGVVLDKGTRLLLNIHVVNATARPLTARTTIEAHTVSSVEKRVELLLAGKTTDLVVPSGESTQLGRCTLQQATTLFAVMPHMHARGVRLAARVEGGEPLYDGPFDADRAAFVPLSPAVTVAAGGRLIVECSYMNTGREPIAFGPSADDEMCYAIFYRSPASGGPAVCVE